jgi:hypothetical protein
MHLLEKDVWVVWVLETLFQAPLGQHLVFKGGSSLSKAYQIIRRFSEDVDLTYDIRTIAPDLVGNAGPLPANPSQEKRWTKAIRARLQAWIAESIVPLIGDSLSRQNLGAKLSVEAENVFISYEPVSKGSGYVRPTVMLEFGARSTGEPCETRVVRPDAAEHLAEVAFPVANPRVMRPERTFWEKATAIHVFCARGEFRGGERFARHWHDLSRLDRAGIADAAIADRNLALAVARHKAIFFSEKNPLGAAIDYQAAVSGGLNIVPTDDALDALSLDYDLMVRDGLLLDDAEPFEELMDSCRHLQERANRVKGEPS